MNPSDQIDGVIFSEDDARLLFGEVATVSVGRMYYDERTGSIRGVSHSSDPEMDARFQHVEVKSDMADDFMQGRRNLSDWMVVYQGDQPTLVPVTTKSITVVPSQQGWTVVTNSESAPVRLILVVPPGELSGALLIHTEEGVSAKPGFDAPFDLRLVKRGSPDEIVGNFSIDPNELFEKGMVMLDFATEISFEIDIITKPLTSVSYEVQPYHEAARPLPMPKGRFEDFHLFAPIEQIEGCPDGLLVKVYEDRIVARLIGGGGRYYDRNMTGLLLALCRAEDKEAMLWRGRVAIDDLRAGDVEIALSEALEGEVSVLSQLYFVNSFVFDVRGKTDETGGVLLPPSPMDLVAATPYDGEPCLLIELDPYNSTIVASLSGGGGRVYARELDDILVALVDPNVPEVSAWSTRINLADLPGAFPVPANVFDEKFTVMVQRYFVNTCWREVAKHDRVGDSFWLSRRPKTQRIDEECLGIWLDTRRNLLRVQAINGGGTRKVAADVVRIDVCETRDPETHIASFYASVEKLSQGEMLGFTIPDEMLKGDFEVLIQSVYTSAYLFE